MTDNQVCPIGPISKTRLSEALSAAWGRVSNQLGRGVFAQRMEVDPKTIQRGIAGPSLPDAENLLNSLAADPNALAEVFALYGLQLVPIGFDAALDFEIIADTSGLLAEHTEAMRDGRRDHRETMRIADKARPVVQRFQSIIAEADRLRGAK